MDSRALFLNLKPKKLFFKAAIPGGISMVVSSLYALFDSIFVGKFLGTTNFAALGLAIPIIIINFALSDLIAVGSAVPISVLLGQKQDEKANNYFTSAIIMILVTGVLMGVFMYFLSPAFMDLLGAEGELKTLAVSYVRVYAVFSPVTTLTFALETKHRTPQSFYGVGGMKIFRDLIYQMRGMMRADHKFYKKQGIYDFPQKKKLTSMKMYLVGALLSNEKILSKMGNKMNEGMIAPYEKMFAKMDKKTKG